MFLVITTERYELLTVNWRETFSSKSHQDPREEHLFAIMITPQVKDVLEKGFICHQNLLELVQFSQSLIACSNL